MDNRKIYTKRAKHDRVVVVDPNKLEDYDGKPVPRYVPMEDLVMYAKLTAHNNAKTILKQGDNGKTTAFGTDEVYINFLNPVNNSNTTTNSLTTKWTELFEENDSYRSETFGIKNIKIEYNASYVPTINITFVDIRGKTLFERGDDPNNPYNIFFQFPYPQFTLTIKGYFGRTVNIPLILEKTNTSFDGQTGDYTTEATFRSFTFALLNDIPLRYIVQAPYMYEVVIDKGGKTSYEGITVLVKILEQYSKSKANGGLGVDLCDFNTDKNKVERNAIASITNVSEYLAKTKQGDYRSAHAAAASYHKKYPITIPDFLYRLSQLESDIANSKTVSRKLSEYNEILQTQEAFAKFEKEFIGAMRSFSVEATPEDGQQNFYYDKKYIVDNSIPSTAKNADEILIFVSNSVGINVINSMSKLTIGGVNYSESLKLDMTVENLRKSLSITKSEDGSKCVINASAFIEKTNKKYLGELDRIVIKAGNLLTKKINLGAKARLGFEPTLKNVLILFLANFETFLTLLYQKSIAAGKQIIDENTNPSTTKENRKRGPYEQQNGVVESYDKEKGSGKPIMHVWPDFFKMNNTEPYVGDFDRTYPGDLYFFRNREEIKFINELIESVVRMQEDTGNRGGNDSSNDRQEFLYTPITPEDVPTMFYENGTLTFDNKDKKDITPFNAEDPKMNSGQFKFSKNGKPTGYTSPLISTANILVKAMENAIFLGFSSANPNNVDPDKMNFDDVASQLGEAHGNNLFNIYKAKSAELLAIHNVFTKSSTDLSTIKIFDDFFINARGDAEADKAAEVSSIKNLINTKYRTMWRNVSLFTQHNILKENVNSVSNFDDNSKKIFARVGEPISLYPGYNSNVYAFRQIDLNENYTRQNANTNGLDNKAISGLSLVADKIKGNHDFYLDKSLIDQIKLQTNSVAYSAPNDSDFNKDNTINFRKLYFGATDKDDSDDRSKYVSNRYYLQDFNPTNEDFEELMFYRSFLYRDSASVLFEEEYEGFNPKEDSEDNFITFDDTDTDIAVGLDTTNISNQTPAGSGPAHIKLLSIMDTLSLIEGTSNVLAKSAPSYFKNNGYDICLDSLSKSEIDNSGGKIAQVIDSNNKKNIIVNWAPDKNIKHPRVINVKTDSTACGRYQFTGENWTGIGKIVFDNGDLPITKYNQDTLGLWTLFHKTTAAKKGGTLFNYDNKAKLFKENSIQELFQSVSSEWSSIPGYYSDKTQYSITEIMDKYNAILEFNNTNKNSFDAKTIEFINTKLNTDSKLI